MTSFAGRTARSQRDYTPVSWTEYFDEAHDVTLGNEPGSEEDEHLGEQQRDSFRVYLKNFKEPFAPNRRLGESLDPNKLEISRDELNNYSKVPTLVALHGGGYSGLTWSQFTRHIGQHCQTRILAMDLRGHGDTKTSNDDNMDIEILVSDVIGVIHAAHRICGFLETPKIVLVGHSMGGAIAVKCATKCVDLLPSLAGFVVIDVVEGTAKDALPMMMSVIKTRPPRFPTLSNAIEWSVRSDMAKNCDAARVSMPGNLVNVSTERLSIHDITPVEADDDSAKTKMLEKITKHKFRMSADQLRNTQSSSPTYSLSRPPMLPRVAALKGGSFNVTSPAKDESPSVTTSQILPESTTIQEEQEDVEDSSKQKPVTESSADSCYKRPEDPDVSGYTWRTNLAKTQPYWNGWFDGLSAQLLAAPVQGKFLLLAGIDRLDKPLTVGHMQGKFMMKVLPKCGHAVHEDVPERVAAAIGDFLVRNKFTVPPPTLESVGCPLTIN